MTTQHTLEEQLTIAEKAYNDLWQDVRACTANSWDGWLELATELETLSRLAKTIFLIKYQMFEEQRGVVR